VTRTVSRRQDTAHEHTPAHAGRSVHGGLNADTRCAMLTRYIQFYGKKQPSIPL